MDEFPRTEFLTPEGLTLVGDVAGPAEAPTVVLLHGGGQTRHSWSGAMRGLVKAGYHVINYDARGHGESDWSAKGDYSLPAFASDLRAILSAIHGPAALVGASLGGIASFFTIGSNDLPNIKALVMVDIVLRPAKAGAEKIAKFMQANPGGFANLTEASDAVAAYNPDRPRPSSPEGLRKNLRERADGRLYWHWDPRLLVSPTPEPPRFDDLLVKVSDRVTVPTLLVRGGHSDIVDDAGVADMLRLVPQTEVHDVPGAGHMVAGDRNDAFNQAVIGFLQRHLPTARTA